MVSVFFCYESCGSHILNQHTCCALAWSHFLTATTRCKSAINVFSLKLDSQRAIGISFATLVSFHQPETFTSISCRRTRADARARFVKRPICHAKHAHPARSQIRDVFLGLIAAHGKDNFHAVSRSQEHECLLLANHPFRKFTTRVRARLVRCLVFLNEKTQYRSVLHGH